MTIKEGLNKLQKTKENEDYFNIWSIVEKEFDLFGKSISDEVDNQNRLKIYYLHKWYCTDTWVGYRAYFLDDELIAITQQVGRKYAEHFHYISKESRRKFKKFVESFIMEEDEDESVSYMTGHDWDHEMGDD